MIEDVTDKKVGRAEEYTVIRIAERGKSVVCEGGGGL